MFVYYKILFLRKTKGNLFRCSWNLQLNFRAVEKQGGGFRAAQRKITKRFCSCPRIDVTLRSYSIKFHNNFFLGALKKMAALHLFRINNHCCDLTVSKQPYSWSQIQLIIFSWRDFILKTFDNQVGMKCITMIDTFAFFFPSETCTLLNGILPLWLPLSLENEGNRNDFVRTSCMLQF